MCERERRAGRGRDHEVKGRFPPCKAFTALAVLQKCVCERESARARERESEEERERERESAREREREREKQRYRGRDYLVNGSFPPCEALNALAALLK